MSEQPLHPYQHAESASSDLDVADLALGDYSYYDEPAPGDPDPFRLPASGQLTHCPACGANSEGWLRYEYHQHGRIDSYCGKKFGYPKVGDIQPHICVHCVKCKWGEPQRLRHMEETDAT